MAKINNKKGRQDKKSRQNKKGCQIGLALSAGAFRGFAHLGVIKALQENNIPINYISGSSIGSLVAAYYALHGEVDSLTDKFSKYKNDLFKLPDLNFRDFRDGFNTPSFIKFIKFLFGEASFSQTKIPLRILATDLTSGEPFIFSHGSIATAVRASSSVPIILNLPKGIKAHLVDGALSNPVPIKVLKKLGAKKIIAVNLYHRNEFKEKNFTLTKIALKSARIALYNLARNDVKESDVLINPDTSYFLKYIYPKRYLSQTVTKQIIDLGYQETNKKRNALKALLK